MPYRVLRVSLNKDFTLSTRVYAYKCQYKEVTRQDAVTVVVMTPYRVVVQTHLSL